MRRRLRESVGPTADQRSEKYLGGLRGLADLLDICQKVVAISAIIIGGIWTYKIFIENRENYRRADIQHEVSIFDLGGDCILLRLTVSIQNTGNILLVLTEGEIRIEQVFPLEPAIADEFLSQKNALLDKQEHFSWPIIKRKTLYWNNGDFEIEPAERDKQPFEFIMCKPPDVININTYVANPDKRGMGWNYSSVVDLREARRG